jgi:DNA-binding transcriptional LysR family regulator
MELRHLRYFVAVAEAENVSRAAVKLHLSQPALSRQIRDLEGEMGFSLFKRSAKSVRLTDAGRVFLEEARGILDRVGQAVESARVIAKGEAGELHVGYAPTLAARILPPTLRAFQAGNPGVRVKLHDLSTGEMLEGLCEGRLQLAFLVRPATAGLRGLRFEELMRDPLRLAVAPDHPFARKQVVKLEEAAHEAFIVYSRKDYPDHHDLLNEVFSAGHGRLRIAEEHDGVSSLISAVEAGNGVALVSQSIACIAGVRMKLIALVPEPRPLVVGIGFPRGRVAPAAEGFVRCARKAVSGK